MNDRGCGFAALAASVVIGLAVALSVGGCGPAPRTGPATPPPTTTPAPVPRASTASLSTSGTSSPSSGGSVVVDPTLLDVLPADIDGQPLRPDPDTAAENIADGGLPAEVEALAVGLYVGPGSSRSDDLAVVNVVRLRPGVFEEEWFRSWRKTYDKAACEVAGGLSPAAAEVEISGRVVHIGTCKGGVHTYHVHLSDPDRVISITSLGDQRFGERVVAGLTE